LRHLSTRSLKDIASEYIWLWDFNHGMTVEQIAEQQCRTVRRIRIGIARRQKDMEFVARIAQYEAENPRDGGA
jgi:hypothetical protein